MAGEAVVAAATVEFCEEFTGENDMFLFQYRHDEVVTLSVSVSSGNNRRLNVAAMRITP